MQGRSQSARIIGYLQKAVPRIEEIAEACRFLNPFYIDSRYPVHWPTHYDKAAALKAKQFTEKIGNWVINSFGN
ncbi:MAG: hypothetical protein CVV39_07140 [Planctomycetes bacterium HGW-Planctomycetes-1]|nr:MAG: hypothetical protein CVV39_07140 [Planctomycetes bacterium HGW-Planctomycetes-1]